MNIKSTFKTHMLALSFLGFNSGFAFILFNATLMMALSFSNFSKIFISSLFVSSLPYSLKVLWSPIMDYYAIPVLSKALGQRRSWLIVAQIGLFISSLGFIIKPTNIWMLSVISIIFVFFAATQDIALDAYRIERLNSSDLATGTTFSITGFRVGCLISGMLPLYLLKAYGWSIAFISASSTLLVAPLVTLLVSEPTEVVRNTRETLPNPMEHLASVYKSFLEFLQRPDWYLIILLIFFYKVGDSIPNAMKGPLLASLNFTPIETANVSAYGTAPMIFGGFLGGILVTKFGMLRGIIIGSSAQLLSQFIYAWLATMQHNILALIITTTFHNIACGLGSTVLVIYVSSLCKRGGATATQFALIYSFSSLTRTVLSSFAGIFATYTDWVTFFISTSFIGLPVFLVIKKLVWSSIENSK